MLDPTLPLTVTEWEEWGNPVDDPEAYDVIAGYAPYENVRPAAYPAILATAGLNDPRVSVPRARQVGASAAGHDDRRPADPAQDRDGRGPRRPDRPLRRLEGRGLRARLRALQRVDRAARLSPGTTRIGDMARLTTTAYLILGLLADRDWSAYELAEQIGKGVTELWPRAGRQLYNVPKRLVAEGLATAQNEATGQRNRTVYSITPAGRAALRTWLATPTAPPALEFEAMIRVLLAPSGTLDDLRTTLDTMGEQARESRDLFVSHARYMLEHDGGTYPERRHLLALANLFMVEHFSNIVKWSRLALEQTEDWDETVAPAQTDPDQSIAILERSIRIGNGVGSDAVLAQKPLDEL